MTEGERAWRDEINPLAAAIDAAESASYHDPARICQARNNYESAIRKWREGYPADARKMDAAKLREQAAHKRDLATGALVYDADGWLNHEAQQQRHDKIMAEAEMLEAQAKILDAQPPTPNLQSTKG